jgi:hypothetical protein
MESIASSLKAVAEAGLEKASPMESAAYALGFHAAVVSGCVLSCVVDHFFVLV